MVIAATLFTRTDNRSPAATAADWRQLGLSRVVSRGFEILCLEPYINGWLATLFCTHCILVLICYVYIIHAAGSEFLVSFDYLALTAVSANYGMTLCFANVINFTIVRHVFLGLPFQINFQKSRLTLPRNKFLRRKESNLLLVLGLHLARRRLYRLS